MQKNIYFMYNKRPFILISNDDGYHANGIKTLVKILQPVADILVCAPEAARSGFSCGFSAVEYLRLKRRHNMGEVEVWSCSGTPVDCVKIALDQLCNGRIPDLILGGINHGDNSSVNNHYSGTVGVALEGCMKYIPSIAFSSCNYDENADLMPLADGILKIIEHTLKEGFPKGTCLNVNFPVAPPFKGVRICRMAYGRWIKEIVKCHHPRNYDYYWVVGQYNNDEPDAEDTDQWALGHGYISITPTKIDVTDYEFMDRLKQWDF